MKNVILDLKSRAGCVFRGIQDSMRDWDSRIRVRYAYCYRYCKIEENTVLYEAYFGRGLLCNPYAIFLELISNPGYRHLKHIWVLTDDKADAVIWEKYGSHPNVRFVKRHSGEYLRALCSAKYLINNVAFHNYFIKKPGQIYVNTWHGIPIKTLGFDMPNGNLETSNVLRNFLQTDYLLSASSFLTEIYRKAYKLDTVYQGKIIEEGYPRLDLLTRNGRSEIIEKLRKYGVEIEDGKEIILYAPTWRGKSYAQASGDVSDYLVFKQMLEQRIDTSRYQILVKVHQRVYELAKEKLTDGFFVPGIVEANEVLSIADILVSDFSSIYFDYLATGRPVLFYIPDLDQYGQERGLYRNMDCLPGPCTREIRELAGMIRNLDEVKLRYAHKYDTERIWSNARDPGCIARKIVDIVFGGNEDGYKIVRFQSEKKKILISKGLMPLNGISTSLLSFLDNLDYEKFDVSVMVQFSEKPEEIELINRINSNARVICRNAPGCCTIYENILQRSYERHGYSNVFHRMYNREKRRCYGDTFFDYVIDFDGYHTFFAILALQFRDAKKFIWQHNDMLAERNRKYPWLDRIFGFYRYFDRVVSCAYDVMLVNRRNLANLDCPAEKFAHLSNFIDVNRISRCIGKSEIRTEQGQAYIVSDSGNESFSGKRIPFYPPRDNFGNRQYRFVTIGRFSVEKNHENLIRAFNKLCAIHSGTYLYLLGDGPLRENMAQLVEELNLADHVIMPGNVSNPFSVLENCDCFILPSLHEGQPMVIMEARSLKMPIIVSDFSSVKGSLVENGQLLIGTSAEEIFRGMMEFIAGNVPCDYHFDPRSYNRRTLREFMGLLGMEETVE